MPTLALRCAPFLVVALPGGVLAAESAPSITDVVMNLNTVWLMVAAALVFFMQAGFALLEGGMSRSKNAVNVIMKTTWMPVSAA